MYFLTDKKVFRKRITALTLCFAMMIFTVVTAYGFEFGYNVYKNGKLIGTFPGENGADKLSAYILEKDGIDISGDITSVLGIVNNGKFTSLEEAADNFRSEDERYTRCFLVSANDEVLFMTNNPTILDKIEGELTLRYVGEGDEVRLSPMPEISEGYTLKYEPSVYEEALEILSEVLTVEVLKKETLYESVPYEEVLVEDDTMYVSDKVVLTEGINEEKYVEYTHVFINGQEVSTFISGETIIKEGMDSVIKVGTIDNCVARGFFINPAEGELTSPFGSRWGRRHEGIDIASPLGTDIFAADGGTVVYSGKMGGYGNFVKIDHGNGYTTCYAHCSELLVGEGDRVYQGQHIAEMGNTGRSTGNHLHFEIEYEGSVLDPMGFIER